MCNRQVKCDKVAALCCLKRELEFKLEAKEASCYSRSGLTGSNQQSRARLLFVDGPLRRRLGARLYWPAEVGRVSLLCADEPINRIEFHDIGQVEAGGDASGRQLRAGSSWRKTHLASGGRPAGLFQLRQAWQASWGSLCERFHLRREFMQTGPTSQESAENLHPCRR